MSKALNWPARFYDEVLSENTDDRRIALRIGSVYYDNSYYPQGEIIDIRVDHKVVRKGQIIDDMRLLKIKELTDEQISQYKSSLNSKSQIIKFLSDNYGRHVDENTAVTVISYKNIATNQNDSIEDPHM